MKVGNRIAGWLETHWVTPAYSGWLLGGFSVFFFIAATNTLTGWLYVLSGIGAALLAIAAFLPNHTLRNLRVQRSPIYPVSVGDQLTIELIVENCTKQPKALLQVQDSLPSSLGKPTEISIETIAAEGTYRWIYYQAAIQRGVYRWQTVYLRTAAPLGLFWCRRSRTAKATAIVYPTVLSLSHCPLVDRMGQDASLQLSSDRRAQSATEGLTRSLRPYRWGDPTRLIHWRTSARYGELRVRELEVFTGGQELVICLDSALSWEKPDSTFSQDFEQAVIAAASLYFYACHQSMSVKFWSAGTGVIQGTQVVLETLAAIHSGETVLAPSLPNLPLVWLTQNPASLSTLPPGSRWILWVANQTSSHWQEEVQTALSNRNTPGIVIDPEKSLQNQLQTALSPR